jgi:ABC-2 type transport system ATP-binding protein
LPEVNPPGTHRFEISAPAITTALRKAQEMALFRSATIFGRSIHALVDESVGQQELEHEMRRRGIPVEEIRPLVPTLEDAFVELSRRRQMQMEAA